MGLINYKDIDFNKSINKENTVINFNGSEIQIIPYLSIKDKYDLIMLTLQNSYENNVYNDIKIHMYFNLYLIYLYTNIIFDVEDRTDEIELYNTLERSGLIKLVKENIDKNEIDQLETLLLKVKEGYTTQNMSFFANLESFIQELPEKFKILRESLSAFSSEDIERIKTLNLLKKE